MQSKPGAAGIVCIACIVHFCVHIRLTYCIIACCTQFLTGISTGTTCGTPLLFSIHPVLYRNSSYAGLPRPTSSSPYESIINLIVTEHTVDGDVIGVLLSMVHWNEAAFRILTKASTVVDITTTTSDEIVRGRSHSCSFLATHHAVFCVSSSAVGVSGGCHGRSFRVRLSRRRLHRNQLRPRFSFSALWYWSRHLLDITHWHHCSHCG